MKVAVFSTKSYDRQYFDQANISYKHDLFYYESPLDNLTVQLAEGFDAVCVFVNDKLDAALMDSLAALHIKLIALRCAGFNNVDIVSAHNHGIKVVRVPAYSPHSVAEHAVALIMTLNRKTHKAYNRVRESNFSLERLTGFDMHGKTVGVIGTGKIGATFCRITLGFGCHVIAYDHFQSEELVQLGVVYNELNEVYKNADIISLHCPLTPDTHHLIRCETLSLMKDGVMLINTSRGGLVDTKEVIKALKSGKIGYVGIDVYEQEENLFFKDLSELVVRDDTIARIMTFPNVLVTAHQAFFTSTALTQIAEITLTNLRDFEAGIISTENEVTLGMLK